MKHSRLYLILITLILGLAACKYDDGPLVSIRSAESRLANTWVPKTALVNGAEALTDQGGFSYIGLDVAPNPWLREITFLEGGECLAFYLWDTEDMAFTGAWSFTSEKTKIAVRVQNTSNHRVDVDWTILHLAERKLKVTYIYDSNLYEVTFVPKK